SDNSILNAASLKFGSAAVGETVVIRGHGLGPQTVTPQQLNDDGTTVLNTLAGVQVMFDANAAPLLPVSSTDIRAVVPYEIAGQTTPQITVINQGAVSNAINLNIAAASPAIFTADGSGAGQIDAKNADGTANTGTNPVARGGVVTFYLTGEGQTN